MTPDQTPLVFRYSNQAGTKHVTYNRHQKQIEWYETLLNGDHLLMRVRPNRRSCDFYQVIKHLKNNK